MALTLTPGSESRLDGAPDLPLPVYTDFVDSVARRLVAMDKEGALYGGDPGNAKADAEKWANDYIEGQRRKTAANRAAAEAGAQRNADARGRQRSAAQGVAPESLPMDEYGSVSGRTVQEANRPQADAEAALMQDQDIADEIVRGYREGDRNWQAEGDRQYSQEYGLGGFDRGPGRSDLDYRRRLQDQQGFIRTPQGMVPVGPQITPERVEALAEFDGWANQTPGTERQALYAPDDYERFREGVRNDIRDDARQDMVDYNAGPADPILRQQLGLPPLSHDQIANRLMRQRSEDRQLGRPVTGFDGTPARGADGKLLPMAASGRRELIARARRQAQRQRLAPNGIAAYANGQLKAVDQPPLTPEETMLLGGTLARDSQRDVRKARVAEQAMLAGGQPTGGPFGTRATTNAINQLGPGWREIALLDRLTNGRVGGPTPLGVEAVGAQNAMRAFTADVLAGNQPGVREQREIAAANAEAGLPIPVRADRERDKNNGVLPANSAAGQAVLQDIATTTIGSSYAARGEVDRAVERAVAEGIPEADAIAFFNRHAQFANSGFWGAILGAGDFGAPPDPGDNPGLPPPGSFAPPM